MHATNFFSEFLDILKNDFWPMGAYTPRKPKWISGYLHPSPAHLSVAQSWSFSTQVVKLAPISTMRFHPVVNSASRLVSLLLRDFFSSSIESKKAAMSVTFASSPLIKAS
jgi:hypothetical protein